MINWSLTVKERGIYAASRSDLSRPATIAGSFSRFAR